MGPKLREKILSQYPEWHQQPLRLTTQEIEQPQLVITEFFDIYNLPTFRACLKQWLDDAIQGIEVEVADHVATYDHVERLAEAAWVMYERMEKEKDKVEEKEKKDEIESDEEDEEEIEETDNNLEGEKENETGNDSGDNEDEANNSFYRLAKDMVSGNPDTLILDVFDDDDICHRRENLDELFSAALKERASAENYPLKYLYAYENLLKLMEAAYLMQLQPFEDRFNEEDPYAIFGEVMEAIPSPELFPERLRPQEWHQPRWAFKSFFELHSLAEWKAILHLFLECCFINEKITDHLDDYGEVHKICDQFQRLQEAAYLIKVMELDKE